MEKFCNFFLEKCLSFSVRIVNLYRHLVKAKNESVISKQLLRSGTSIGANYSEATNAISQADFRNKCSISLKEATESRYWIELLHRTEYITPEQYNSLMSDLNELIAILTTTIKKVSNKTKKE